MNEPLSDQNSHKTGLLLLSGFLGAGKTTLLKRILSWETDLAGTVILVNEFGDIGIDGSLLKDSFDVMIDEKLDVRSQYTQIGVRLDVV